MNNRKKAVKNQKKLQKQINFGLFPSLSFLPSQSHNSINIRPKSTSRIIFGNWRTRAFIWHPWFEYWIKTTRGNHQFRKSPSLYVPYCNNILWTEAFQFQFLIVKLRSWSRSQVQVRSRSGPRSTSGQVTAQI